MQWDKVSYGISNPQLGQINLTFPKINNPSSLNFVKFVKFGVIVWKDWIVWYEDDYLNKLLYKAVIKKDWEQVVKLIWIIM